MRNYDHRMKEMEEENDMLKRTLEENEKLRRK
jgi:hypothetical protein